jgi:hypothetical protein
MKEFYKKRIEELKQESSDLENLAVQEMNTGSGARAMEYSKMVDAKEREIENYSAALGQMK